MPAQTQFGVPPSIQCGDTVNFEISDGLHPAGTWTSVIYISRNGAAPVSANGSANGLNHQFSISAATTATLVPGLLDYMIRFTETSSGQVETGNQQGTIVAVPNLASAQSSTTAQRLLSAIEGALKAFAGSDKASVSFNGQTFTRANIADYMRQRVALQAEVKREKELFAAARGTALNDRAVVTQFVSDEICHFE